MRSMWKGTISFGLVTIPIKLYSATEEHDVALHQVHRADGGRIRYQRVCSVDHEEVPYAEIAKGFETNDGQMVVLTDDDLADLPLASSKTIDVLSFVPLEQVDPIYFSKSYYVAPEPQGARPYQLLRDALAASGRVAVVKVAIRQRESLATLRIRDGVFVLETMLWPDEVRTPDFESPSAESTVRPQELKMAATLIDTLSSDFDPTEYTDSYSEALQALIDAKIEGREVVTPEAEAPPAEGKVLDLMAVLEASVQAAKKHEVDKKHEGNGGKKGAVRAGEASDRREHLREHAGRQGDQAGEEVGREEGQQATGEIHRFQGTEDQAERVAATCSTTASTTSPRSRRRLLSRLNRSARRLNRSARRWPRDVRVTGPSLSVHPMRPGRVSRA